MVNRAHNADSPFCWHVYDEHVECIRSFEKRAGFLCGLKTFFRCRHCFYVCTSLDKVKKHFPYCGKRKEKQIIRGLKKRVLWCEDIFCYSKFQVYEFGDNFICDVEDRDGYLVPFSSSSSGTFYLQRGNNLHILADAAAKMG